MYAAPRRFEQCGSSPTSRNTNIAHKETAPDIICEPFRGNQEVPISNSVEKASLVLCTLNNFCSSIEINNSSVRLCFTMTAATIFNASPAPRQPGMRATFTPRKEEKVFLARGEHTFTLPGRKTRAKVQVDVDAESDEQALDAVETTIVISLAQDGEANFAPVARWVKLDRLAKTSLHGVVNEDRATYQHAWSFELLDGDLEPQRAVWAAIYSCK